jgi:hypothetical protein
MGDIDVNASLKAGMESYCTDTSTRAGDEDGLATQSGCVEDGHG